MKINRNKTVQRLPLHTFPFSLYPFLWKYSSRFCDTEKMRIFTVFEHVCVRSLLSQLSVRRIWPKIFAWRIFTKSDWKERVRMCPAVTLPAHGVVCVCVCVTHASTFFRFSCFVLVLYYLLLFFHSCSMPFVFPPFSFPFHSFFISDCMFFTVASQHLPVFCRFHLILHTFLSLLSPRFRSAMIYCTSERRANSYLIKKL